MPLFRNAIVQDKNGVVAFAPTLSLESNATFVHIGNGKIMAVAKPTIPSLTNSFLFIFTAGFPSSGTEYGKDIRFLTLPINEVQIREATPEDVWVNTTKEEAINTENKKMMDYNEKLLNTNIDTKFENFCWSIATKENKERWYESKIRYHLKMVQKTKQLKKEPCVFDDFFSNLKNKLIPLGFDASIATRAKEIKDCVFKLSWIGKPTTSCTISSSTGK